MKEKELAELTDVELLEKVKKNKSGNLISAVLCGCIVGISIFSTFKNGFGIFTVFPLFFLPMLVNSREKGKALEAELKSRNLK